MSDVFAQNWLKRVKKDPIMNAVYTGTPMVEYDARTYVPGILYGTREDVGARRVINEPESEAVKKKEFNVTYEDENRQGVNIRHGKVKRKYIDSTSYWENSGPTTFYNLSSNNTFHNPLIDKLKK